MAYAKLASKLLKPAFKHGIRLLKKRKGVISGVKARKIKENIKFLADKPQRAINPKAQRLTKSQMMEGLDPELKKAAQKRLKQVDVWAEKRKISEGRYAEGLKKKRAYEEIHGKGTFKKYDRDLYKSGGQRSKETLPKLAQVSKSHRKSHKEVQIRDLTQPRSQYDDLKIQKEGARHHKAGINTSYPLFDNLPYKDAQKLRKYAKKFDAEFGDLLSNLVDVPGTTKHAMGNIHNSKLHAWMRRVGLDTPPQISPDAGWEVRARVMQNYITDLRKQAIKLKDLMNPKETAKLKKILGSKEMEKLYGKAKNTDVMPVEQLTTIKPSLTLKDLGINK